MRRTGILTVVLIFAVVSAGCVSRARESIISVDRFIQAMEEYDAEEYDSRDEIFEQADNPRATLAGMYCRVEPEFSGVTDQLLFVQGFENEDGSNVNIAASLYAFASEDDASEYCQSYCDSLNEQTPDDGEEILITDLTKDNVSCTCRTSFRRLNLECTAVYQEYDHVLVLTGLEYKTNEMSSFIDELCGLLDIPSPDLSDYDCNERLDPEVRIPELKVVLGAEEIPASDFDLSNEIDREGCFYVHTDDFKDIAGVLDDERLAMYSEVISADIFYSVDSDPADERASRFVVMRVLCNSDADAMDFYYSIRADIDSRGDTASVSLIDEGEEGDILFSKYKITDPYMSASYNLYSEGDSAYIMSFLNMDEDVASEAMQQVCDIMGLP